MLNGRMKLENITKQLKIESSRGESYSANKETQREAPLLFHGDCSKEQLIAENDVDTPIRRCWNTEWQEP